MVAGQVADGPGMVEHLTAGAVSTAEHKTAESTSILVQTFPFRGRLVLFGSRRHRYPLAGVRMDVPDSVKVPLFPFRTVRRFLVNLGKDTPYVFVSSKAEGLGSVIWRAGNDSKWNTHIRIWACPLEEEVIFQYPVHLLDSVSKKSPLINTP